MSEKLAIHGGPKAKTTPNFPMYPGGLEIGEDEKKEVMEVLDNKYLFRYYGPSNMPSKVRAFENAFNHFSYCGKRFATTAKIRIYYRWLFNPFVYGQTVILFIVFDMFHNS